MPVEKEPEPITAGNSAAGGVLYEVPAGKKLSVSAPHLLVLPGGRFLVAFDLTGPDVKKLPGKKGHVAPRNRWIQGGVMSSADGGQSWRRVATYPFRSASLFRDGGDVYLLGEISGGLILMRSPDGGSSWSTPMDLSGESDLRLSPTRIQEQGDYWWLPCLVPSGDGMGLCVWRAPKGASLMNRKAWVQGPVSPPLSNWIAGLTGGCGIPLGGVNPVWRDPVPVRLEDPSHPWYQENSLLLLCAARTGRQHWAGLMRVDCTRMIVDVQSTPEGVPWLWLPCPGGHQKFDLMPASDSSGFWLAGSCGVPGLPLGRAVPPAGECRCLGLWFSQNLAEWQRDGILTAGGGGPEGTRSDPCIMAEGPDLVWVCRAGGEESRNSREPRRLIWGKHSVGIREKV